MLSLKNHKKTVVVLGGGLIKDKKGVWHTTTFKDQGDKFGVSGDRFRIIAAAELYKKNKDLDFIASGGKGQLKIIKKAPYLADIIKKELINLGIPGNKIIKEKKSGNTFQQLKELKKIIDNKKLNEVIIISNKYHLPRIKAILQYRNEFFSLNKKGKIKLVAAENIISQSDKKQKEFFSNLYRSKLIIDRIKLEKNGVKQIKQGTYKFI